MTDDKWTMCKLCGGKELVRMTQMDGSRFTVADCPQCVRHKKNQKYRRLVEEHIRISNRQREDDRNIRAENAKLREESQELNDLFDLQQTRMHTATKKWQEATGKHDIFPDLGRLLDWLLADTETNDG